MLKKYKFIALGIIMLVYAFMQMATKKDLCDPDCQTLRSIYEDLGKTYPAVNFVQRCSLYAGSDSICVYVNASVTNDWNQVAERTCILATANGLPRQKVYILSSNSTTSDTLARLQCP